jgi:pimeloyl-ACP methyl ester carboxylesterase
VLPYLGSSYRVYVLDQRGHGDSERPASGYLRAEQDSLSSALPNSVLKIYSETGHAPHWERPEQFAHDLLGFISEEVNVGSTHAAIVIPSG